MYKDVVVILSANECQTICNALNEKIYTFIEEYEDGCIYTDTIVKDDIDKQTLDTIQNIIQKLY
jgi:hypothetical protein